MSSDPFQQGSTFGRTGQAGNDRAGVPGKGTRSSGPTGHREGLSAQGVWAGRKGHQSLDNHAFIPSVMGMNGGGVPPELVAGPSQGTRGVSSGRVGKALSACTLVRGPQALKSALFGPHEDSCWVLRLSQGNRLGMGAASLGGRHA